MKRSVWKRRGVLTGAFLALAVLIGLTVKTVQADSWYDLSGGTLTVYDGTTEIPDRAFMNKTDIQKVILPESLRTIGNQAFQGCTNLDEIDLPEGLTRIGYCAFEQCSDLEEVTLPASLTDFDNSSGAPFNNCASLKAVKVVKGNQSYKSVDGVLFTADGTELCQYPAGKEETTYAVPDGTETIGRSSFKGNSYLVTVHLPESVIKIDIRAFKLCDKLCDVELPDSVDAIGEGAFEETGSLKP